MNGIDILHEWTEYREIVTDIAGSMIRSAMADGNEIHAMEIIDEYVNQLIGFADGAYYLTGHVSEKDFKDWKSYIIHTWRAEMYNKYIAKHESESED